MKTFSIDGASGGSGWGVAKAGTVTIAPRSTETVSIADLGFTSVDDYIVLFSNSTFGQFVTIIDRTIQSFTFVSTSGETLDVSYAVIAKGYGGGGGGGQ